MTLEPTGGPPGCPQWYRLDWVDANTGSPVNVWPTTSYSMEYQAQAAPGDSLIASAWLYHSRGMAARVDYTARKPTGGAVATVNGAQSLLAAGVWERRMITCLVPEGASGIVVSASFSGVGGCQPGDTVGVAGYMVTPVG